MRKFIATLLFMPFICAFTNAQTEELLIEVKYDRFKDSTSIATAEKYNNRMFSKMWGIQPRLFVGITYSGKTPPKGGVFVDLVFHSINDSWRYLNSYDLYCLADDKPIEMPETKRSGEVKKGLFVIETIYCKLSYETFEQLCKASKLEFKLAHKEFAVSEEEQIALKQLKQVYEEQVKKHEKEK